MIKFIKNNWLILWAYLILFLFIVLSYNYGRTNSFGLIKENMFVLFWSPLIVAAMFFLLSEKLIKASWKVKIMFLLTLVFVIQIAWWFTAALDGFIVSWMLMYMGLIVFSLAIIFVKIMVKIFSKFGVDPVNAGVGISAFCMATIFTINNNQNNILTIFLFAFIVSMFSGKIVVNLAKRKGYSMVNAGIIGAFFPIFGWIIYKLLLYKNREKTLNTDQYIAENWLALMFVITIIVAILFMSAWRFFI